MKQLSDCTVLVVDDTEANIDILVEALGEAYEVSVATDGKAALEAANEDDPDLILLDVMMPEMDGYEVCERLKANAITKDIPVIFITAKTEEEDETRGFELGAVDFIAKPISIPIVQSRVRSALSLKLKTDQLEELSDKLSRYLSPQIYESLFSGQTDALLKTERKKLTIFYSDIVNFTGTTERMEPEDMTALLNSYLDAMSEIAIKHGGTIDKFIGDAILIFFGDPVSRGVEADARACVNMALEMRAEMKNLQKRWFDKGIETPFKVRTGINTGYTTVGNFGSRSKLDYTIIGQAVNIAARLEQNCEPNQILISHETWALVKEEIFCVKKPSIQVKGVSHEAAPYQVVGHKDTTSHDDTVLSIGDLVRPVTTVDHKITVREVLNILSDADPLGCVCVTEKGSPQGLVVAYHLDCVLIKDTDRTLYMDRPVTEVMDNAALFFDGATAVAEAASQALDRERAHRYDPVIVVRSGKLLGVVYLDAMLEKLASQCLKYVKVTSNRNLEGKAHER